jgi:hypothetical protein
VGNAAPHALLAGRFALAAVFGGVILALSSVPAIWSF